MGKQNAQKTGISTLGLLGVALIVLKLTGYIDWKWIWVLVPFWGGIAIVLGVLAILGIIALFLMIKNS